MTNNNKNQKLHYSVMLNEILDIFTKNTSSKNTLSNQNLTFIDATFGCGGHTKELIKKGANVIAIDRDPQAKIRFNQLHQSLSEQSLITDNSNTFDNQKPFLLFEHTLFSKINQIIDKYNSKIDGILWDFGLCTTQLNSKRGFSFYSNDFLDMGMGLNDKTACHILNTYSVTELTKIFTEYGDEIKAYYYAKLIVEKRMLSPFQNMQDLISLFDTYTHKRIHPATKIIQALRIAVNNELAEIENSVSYALKNCKSGTKLVCISFHSGEDRIIKNLFKQAFKDGLLADYSKKPLEPSLEEVKINPASRSAKMRWCVLN